MKNGEMMKRAWIAILALALSCISVQAQTLSKPIDAAVIEGKPVQIETIAQLHWIEGQWLAQKGEQTIDEFWSLKDQSLLGVSRVNEAGKSKSIELLVLEKKAVNWVLRLRVFGPAIDKATRGKEEPLQLQLIVANDRKMQFEGIGNELGVSLVYELTSPETMEAKLSKSRDGKFLFSEEFHFTRAKLKVK